MPEILYTPTKLNMDETNNHSKINETYFAKWKGVLYPLFSLTQDYEVNSFEPSEEDDLDTECEVRSPDIYTLITNDVKETIKTIRDPDQPMFEAALSFFSIMDERVKYNKYNAGPAASFFDEYKALITPYRKIMKAHLTDQESGTYRRASIGAQFNQNIVKLFYFLGNKSLFTTDAIAEKNAFLFFMKTMRRLATVSEFSDIADNFETIITGSRAQATLMRYFEQDQQHKWVLVVPDSEDKKELQKLDVKDHVDFAAWNKDLGWLLVDSKSNKQLSEIKLRISNPIHFYRKRGIGITDVFDAKLNFPIGKDLARHITVELFGNHVYLGWFGENITSELRDKISKQLESIW